jgi:hypothetical protein
MADSLTFKSQVPAAARQFRARLSPQKSSGLVNSALGGSVGHISCPIPVPKITFREKFRV